MVHPVPQEAIQACDGLVVLAVPASAHTVIAVTHGQALAGKVGVIMVGERGARPGQAKHGRSHPHGVPAAGGMQHATWCDVKMPFTMQTHGWGWYSTHATGAH